MQQPARQWSRQRDIGSPDEDHRWHLDRIRAAQQHRRDFAPLYDRYATDVYDYCRRRLGTPEEAADVTAQVFTRALMAIGRFTPDDVAAGAAFRGWLFRIARSATIDHHRRQRPSVDIDEVHGIHDRARRPEEIVIARDEAEHVHRVLQQLPDRQRDIIELRLLDLSGQEIADVLGISLSAMKSAQFRAMNQLRQLLTDDDEGSCR